MLESGRMLEFVHKLRITKYMVSLAQLEHRGH